VAFANSSVTGEVAIYDVQRQAAVNIVKAHVGPLASVAVSNNGSMLATASDSGTVVRVFALPSCERMHTFRRGSAPVRVSCLSFLGLGTSSDDMLLCGSSSDTVHGFALSSSFIKQLTDKMPMDYSVSANHAAKAVVPVKAGGTGGGFFDTVSEGCTASDCPCISAHLQHCVDK
jgi:autophagy-related protein 18